MLIFSFFCLRFQGYVDQWRDIIEGFDGTLRQREETIQEHIRKVQEGLQKWNKELRSIML